MKGLDMQQTYFVEPGEDHELNGPMHIRLSPESDLEWGEDGDQDTFSRRKRQPSFVSYHYLKVVSPTLTANSSASTLSEQTTTPPRKISSTGPGPAVISPLQAIRERLITSASQIGSQGSYSFSQSVSKSVTSFLDSEECTPKTLLSPQTSLEPSEGYESERKISGNSISGTYIRIEPDGQSLMLTREPSIIPEEREFEETVEVNNDDDESGLRMSASPQPIPFLHPPPTSRRSSSVSSSRDSGAASERSSDSEPVVKHKKHRHKAKQHKSSKCKVS